MNSGALWVNTPFKAIDDLKQYTSTTHDSNPLQQM